MAELSQYCLYCGAARAPESQSCFSCQRPFVAAAETDERPLLHGRYQLLTQVGSGGFAEVDRAFDSAEQRIVAVKGITLHGLSAQEIIEATRSFHSELSLLPPLRHPGLPVIYETFTDSEHWYLVMDFIEGETLERSLASRGRLSFAETLQIGLQLCAVLEYLHTREPAIIFRDLKPGNVMRTPGGKVFLIDFGIARLFRPGQARDTIPFGSPGYAAPEQYGRSQTTPQADIYSLGALLHALVTGDDPAEHPFRFAALPQAASARVGELNTLLQQMVAIAPEERPASVARVKIVLQHLASELLPRAEDAGSAQLAALQPGRSRRAVLITALKTGAVIVGTVGGVAGCEIFSRIPHPAVGLVALPPPSPVQIVKQLIYRGHHRAITALGWSPDGTMVASGSADGTVQVWRSGDGALLYTLYGYTDPVTTLSWATDRRNVIASAGNTDGTVQVWDALRDHQDLVFYGEGRVLALDWKYQSPWIVSGGTNPEIYTWHATSGGRGVSYRGHTGNVNALLWLFRPAAFTAGRTPALLTSTPSSIKFPVRLDLVNMIASAGADGTVQLWDARTGQTMRIYREHTAAVNSLALVPNTDPSSLTIASASDDGRVHVWNTVVWDEQALTRGIGSSENMGVYTGHAGQKVNAVTALSDFSRIPQYRELLASAGDDGTVQIWSASQLQTVFTYTGHSAAVKTLAFSPVPADHRIVSGDASGQVHLWTVELP